MDRKTIPDVAGKPFSEARDLMAASGTDYEAVGSDGVKFTDRPPATAAEGSAAGESR